MSDRGVTIQANYGALLRPVEAAVYLGCAVSTIYRMIHRGEVLWFKTPRGAIRIPQLALEAFLEQRVVADAEQITATAGSAAR